MSTTVEADQIPIHRNGQSYQSKPSIDHDLHRISAEFIPGRQQDASLFLLRLLDHCSTCLTLNTQRSSNFQSSSTVIEQVFGIGIRSTIKCLSCSNQTQKLETGYMLSIDVNDLNSLTSALARFFRREILTDENAYNCHRCVELVDAEKHLAIHEAPPILIVNFKRSFNEGSSLRKLVHQIQYNDTIDISTYLTDELITAREQDKNDHSNQYLYHLYAVIVHTGIHLETGHYFTCVRTKGNTWIMINDELCHQVPRKHVLNHQSAYVLFYARASELKDPSDLICVTRDQSRLKRSQ